MSVIKGLLLMIAGFLLLACQKEKSDPVVLDVNCEADTIFSGEKIEFLIRAFSVSGNLREISLTSFNREQGQSLEKSFLMDTPTWKEYYIYDVPLIVSDTLKHTITFRARDNNDDTDSFVLPLILIKERRK